MFYFIHTEFPSSVFFFMATEAIVEVLPRLFKIKYESGILEELLYVDMPHEYQNSSGQIVLDYAKAIQESVFEHLRVVRDGQLRIVFTPDLKVSTCKLKIYIVHFCHIHLIYPDMSFSPILVSDTLMGVLCTAP